MLMLKVFLVAIALIAIAFSALGIRVLFTKNGQFPHTHVGGNRELMKRGIFCAQTWDKMEQKKVKKAMLNRLKPDPGFFMQEIKNN